MRQSKKKFSDMTGDELQEEFWEGEARRAERFRARNTEAYRKYKRDEDEYNRTGIYRNTSGWPD